MTLGPLGLFLGLFCIPGLLLSLGHRLRGRSKRHKRRFWGGVLGYVVGVGTAVLAMLLPPVGWAEDGGLRPLLVHWAMLVGGLVGVLTGPLWARPPGRRPPKRPS